MFNSFVSITTVVIYGLYGVAHFYDNKLIDNTLLNFLLILSIYFFSEFITLTKKIIYIILSSLSLGYACIVKPNFLLMIVFYIFILIFSYKRKALLYCAIMLLFISLIILPITVRNYMVTKDIVLISAYGGLVFYAGNKYDAKPYFEGLPISTNVSSLYGVIRNYVQEETGKEMRPSEVSNYYFKKGLRFVINHPFSWIKLAGSKLYLSLGNYEQEANYSYDLEENPYKKFFIMSYGLIIALIFSGIIFLRKCNIKIALILIPIIVVYLTIAILYMIPRLRSPAIPFLSIIAALSIENFLSIDKIKKIIQVIIIIMILYISLFYIKPPYKYNLQANEYIQSGLVYMNMKDYKRAEDYFKKSINIEPTFSKGYACLGLLYKTLDQDQKALENYKLALSINENDAETHNNISSIYFRNNNIEMAEKHLQRAYELNPYNASILYNMAILRLTRNDKTGAMYYYDRAMKYGAIDNANLKRYFNNY